MRFNEHLTEFAGRPVVDGHSTKGRKSPKKYALRWPPDHRIPAYAISAVVVGWPDPDEFIHDPENLPALRHLFLGDVTHDEMQISWLNLSDVAPLLRAYPRLESFHVRGCRGLRFAPPLRHEALRTVVVQSGGLPGEALADLFQADLPNLEHLELWLGDPNYGGVNSVNALRPLLTGDLFPKLRYLGLRNSRLSDDIAAALATSSLLERIDVLDLSLGTFGDAGADALLTSPALRRLRRLVLAHHYLSEAACERLRGLGIDVDLSDPQGDDDFRYVAVSE